MQGRIEPHFQRAQHLEQQGVHLLTPEQEAELEKDLVPEEQWRAVRVLPLHRHTDHPRGPNEEEINDRVKLLFHRLIARRLGQDPSLIKLARQELAEIQDQREERTYMKEWEEILSLDIDTLRRVIVSRDPQMTRLRISSPMGPLIDMRDPELRRRIWRNARRALSAAPHNHEAPGPISSPISTHIP